VLNQKSPVFQSKEPCAQSKAPCVQSKEPGAQSNIGPYLTGNQESCIQMQICIQMPNFSEVSRGHIALSAGKALHSN